MKKLSPEQLAVTSLVFVALGIVAFFFGGSFAALLGLLATGAGYIARKRLLQAGALPSRIRLAQIGMIAGFMVIVAGFLLAVVFGA